MKLGLGISKPTEERLRYVKQLGGDGVTCFAQAMPGYAERGHATSHEIVELQKAIQAYDLELLGAYTAVSWGLASASIIAPGREGSQLRLSLIRARLRRL